MKQFGIAGNLTPFQPANPALDIPNGDPLELKKVTDQSMNAFYGELANAITKSGQTLTPANGTSPNQSQLWQAISANSFNGNVFVDAGGSTAQVRNLQAANPNTYLPLPIDGDPSSLATKNQWIGFCFAMENAQSAAYNTPVTVNFKDKNGVTIMTTTLATSLLFSPLYGQAGSTYIDCVIQNDSTKTINARRSHPSFTKIASGTSTLEVDNSRPVGQRFTIASVQYSSNSFSTTSWNTISLPVSFTEIRSVSLQASQGSFSTSFFSATYDATSTGSALRILVYRAVDGGQVTPISFGQGSIVVIGYS